MDPDRDKSEPLRVSVWLLSVISRFQTVGGPCEPVQGVLRPMVHIVIVGQGNPGTMMTNPCVDSRRSTCDSSPSQIHCAPLVAASLKLPVSVIVMPSLGWCEPPDCDF